MIYLIQNDREYDYDVRAIALAFYERTKIVEVTTRVLGKGKKFTECTEDQVELMAEIVDELKEL